MLRVVAPAVALASAFPADAQESFESTREFPFLADEPSDGARSIGDTSDGYLVGGRRLEESEHLKILPRQKERDIRYGTDALLATLTEASEALRRTHGRPLWLGNLSRAHGGDIPWSVSHNSGRDADIAFAYTDRGGNPVDPPDLVPLDRAGVSREFGLRFDAKRTWQIVRALLESPHAEVQYLFISVPLKAQLLAHARSLGEPAALMERAAEILKQPAGAGPHDDHLHLRVYCTERDVLAGCIDAGVAHPWHRPHDEAKQRRIREVTAFLDSEAPDQRRRAIERLVLLGAEDSLGRIVHRLDDDDAEVRRAAVDAIGAFDAERHASKLDALWDKERDVTVKLAIVRAATALGCSTSGTLLAKSLVAVEDRQDDELESMLTAWRSFAFPAEVDAASRLLRFEERPVAIAPLDLLLRPILPVDEAWLLPLETRELQRKTLQLAALDGAARAERLEPVPALLGLLDAPDADIRAAADRALAFVTNLDEQLSAPKVEGSTARQRWVRKVGATGGGERDPWVVAGFRARGFNVREVDRRYAWELVRAIGATDHLSFNAQRTLMRLFQHRPPSLTWPKKDACHHWLRWLGARPTEVRAGRAPTTLYETCERATG
jgi:murein endopeptidase